MYKEEIINTLIDHYHSKIRRYDNIENVKWILSIIVSVIGLANTSLIIAVAIILTVATVWLLKIGLDFSMDYVLATRVKYEEIYDALIEIKLEIIKNRLKRGK